MQIDLMCGNFGYFINYLQGGNGLACSNNISFAWALGSKPSQEQKPNRRGARLILEFFLFFLEFFFVFWVSHVFSFFFWYFPFILLDFPVNSDVFFTFVSLKNKKAGGGLGGRAQRLPPRCIGCCCICSCCISCFVLPFFFLILMSYVFWFFVCSWKRCGGERSHP